ncbi:DUF2637 domain-containing protein [Streptomyces thermoalcalitolerans]|uniref:DUF2637 domain-containing protein n=1 Tax=Streptomyces thermoalcalitolerans TaxID=65605 RepID=A0ABP3ZJ96_9ACTN
MNGIHSGAQIRSAERALSVGTWLIVCGAMLYSVLTVTPLMAAHTPDEWDWTAPILPLVVDAAVVIVVRLDSVLARLGERGGRWPVTLRWMTGVMTLALNTADSALKKDLVGVAVHAVAPLLLIVTAETGLAYRRSIAAAVTALEERQRAERERIERERREREREQREHEARLAREQAEREERRWLKEQELQAAREAAERAERERREREREQRERERERIEREAAERRERERREREERERRERQARAEQAERERAALLARGPATGKLPEDEARRIVAAAFTAGLPVRQTAELCGWSVGWVSARYAEHRAPAAGGAELAIASR